MLKTKLFLLFLLLAYSTCDSEKVEAQVTKLEKTVDTATANPEKRDVSNTGNIYNSAQKDEPFRPMFRIPYAQKLNAPTPAPQKPIGLRYITPATPTQSQYSKEEQPRGGGGVQYANDQYVYKTINSNAPYQETPSATYPTAPSHSTYQNAAYQQQQQQQQQQYYVPQATLTSVDTAAHGPPAQNYIYTSQINNQVDYANQQQHQQQRQYYYRTQQPQAQQQVQPQSHTQLQQQQQTQQPIKYLLAVPHSYLQQLQKQYYSQAQHQQYQSPLAAAHPMIQVIGPLARDHQGIYRPIHQPSEPAASASGAPTQKYTIQYLQIPLSRLLAAAQPALAQPNYQTSYQPSVEQNSVVYHQYPQATPAYAEQQQQPQQSYQARPSEQQSKPISKVLQVSSPKPKLAVHQSQQHTAATNTATQQQQQQHQIVHYNPYYVQPPPAPEQQPLLGPLQFTRYSHALPMPVPEPVPTVPQHHAVPPAHLPYVRVVPANRYFAPVPIAQPGAYESPQSHISVSFPHNYEAGRAPMQYTAQANYVNGGPQSSAVPYYQHGAGVHYGTHLYHPPTPSLAAAKALDNRHQQPQYQEQAQQQSGSSNGGDSAGVHDAAKH